MTIKPRQLDPDFNCAFDVEAARLGLPLDDPQEQFSRTPSMGQAEPPHEVRANSIAIGHEARRKSERRSMTKRLKDKRGRRGDLFLLCFECQEMRYCRRREYGRAYLSPCDHVRPLDISQREQQEAEDLFTPINPPITPDYAREEEETQ